ncbi:MAG: hypothetical protein IT222_02095, partial [Crocinitomix sp.]|nr:hypothetical protein [Crocinitomix sp.]
MLNSTNSILESVVNNFDESVIKRSGPGLLSGKTGTALFLLYYSRYSDSDAAMTHATNLIMDVHKAIQKGFNYSTFCDGLSGYAWTLEHLIQNEFLDHENASILDDLDPILFDWSIDLMNKGDFDFLAGSMGTAIYFTLRNHRKECQLYLAKYLDLLESKATIE